jgi:hypothetical protein
MMIQHACLLPAAASAACAGRREVTLPAHYHICSSRDRSDCCYCLLLPLLHVQGGAK